MDATDTEGNTGLHLAVKNGHTNIALALINNGANLNVKNKVSFFKYTRICNCFNNF